MTAAVGVSDIFLKDGELIVYTQGRVADAELKYNASTHDATDGVPMVVLINQGSASASGNCRRRLAGPQAWHDYGSELICKGSVQTVLPLKENAALKLTTARYYTPLGRSIQAEGIAPDILVNETHKDGEKGFSVYS